MDDQARVTTYGNLNLPEGTDERPLVTFALFAYNQEKYIREAVEGAFSQTYSPLEIILSDDCSSDRTFEIMQEMAAAYEGPHQVAVRQNAKNLGLIGHVNVVAASAAGDPIILAAGDDVSCARRTERICAKFVSDPSTLLVHSCVLDIDHNGTRVGLRYPPLSVFQDNLSAAATSSSLYVGASGAIRKNLYHIFGSITEVDTYEDLIFGFRAALLQSCYYIDEPLVHYRANIGISSRRNRMISHPRDRRIKAITHRVATLRQRILDAETIHVSASNNVIHCLERELELSTMRLTFYQSPGLLFLSAARGRLYAPLKAISSEIKYVLGFLN